MGTPAVDKTHTRCPQIFETTAEHSLPRLPWAMNRV